MQAGKMKKPVASHGLNRNGESAPAFGLFGSDIAGVRRYDRECLVAGE
jgi:hypothetical protein